VEHTAEQLKTKQGALAEYAIVTADNVITRPPNVSAIDASGLALAGLTALQGLVDAKLQDGQRVFVNGGSSSVGGYAIQIAKTKGYTVVSSCSAKNIDYVKSLGADEVNRSSPLALTRQKLSWHITQVLDYTASPLHTQLAEKYATDDKKFHAIFDTVGLLNPNLYSYSNKYIANKGIFVTVGPYLTQKGEWFLTQGLRTVWNSFLRPTFLGGAKAKFK
jgi:NADPH:quinone reductase-like Zn-dependent oxidoreductase